jgi:hypothetical protein
MVGNCDNGNDDVMDDKADDVTDEDGMDKDDINVEIWYICTKSNRVNWVHLHQLECT